MSAYDDHAISESVALTCCSQSFSDAVGALKSASHGFFTGSSFGAGGVAVFEHATSASKRSERRRAIGNDRTTRQRRDIHSDMDRASIAGTARAQRLARDIIHEVAESLRPGDREIDVAQKIDEACERAKVHRFLHTAYAWWGDRTRFAKFVDWEPDALPTTRPIEEGECFILDVAPIVDGYVADYALSGVVGKNARDGTHPELLDALREVKQKIVDFAKKRPSGGELMRRVGSIIDGHELDAIHPMYPGNVLGHTLDVFPSPFGKIKPIGKGFQLPLLGTYALELVRHRLRGTPYPLINYEDRGEIRGLWAVEPHVARGDIGAKFESILVVDGDETRWLDPELFGEVAS